MLLRTQVMDVLCLAGETDGCTGNLVVGLFDLTPNNMLHYTFSVRTSDLFIVSPCGDQDSQCDGEQMRDIEEVVTSRCHPKPCLARQRARVKRLHWVHRFGASESRCLELLMLEYLLALSHRLSYSSYVGDRRLCKVLYTHIRGKTNYRKKTQPQINCAENILLIANLGSLSLSLKVVVVECQEVFMKRARVSILPDIISLSTHHLLTRQDAPPTYTQHHHRPAFSYQLLRTTSIYFLIVSIYFPGFFLPAQGNKPIQSDINLVADRYPYK